MARHLRANALTGTASVVLGVASTAPAYSLAVTIGVLGVGTQAPAAILLSFLPMLTIAIAYRELNADEPDAGTSFAWVDTTAGPFLGWLSGWAILLTDLISFASLGQVMGDGTALLVHGGPAWLYGTAWLLLATWLCYRGITVAAWTQTVLLAIEVLALLVIAWWCVAHSTVTPSLGWLNPLHEDMIVAITVGIFMFWGWDTTVAATEETVDSRSTPGRAAVTATLWLLLMYLGVTVAVFMHDPHTDGDDVFANLTPAMGGLAAILIGVALISSALASSQTTILPSARTMFSMARRAALPATFARVHPRLGTPTTSTVVSAVSGIAIYLGVTWTSPDALESLIEAIGLLIAFYYSLTGVVCAWRFRHSSARRLAQIWTPLIGAIALAAVFVAVLLTSSHTSVILGVGSLLLGVPFATLYRRSRHARTVN